MIKYFIIIALILSSCTTKKTFVNSSISNNQAMDKSIAKENKLSDDMFKVKKECGLSTSFSKEEIEKISPKSISYDQSLNNYKAAKEENDKPLFGETNRQDVITTRAGRAQEQERMRNLIHESYLLKNQMKNK